VTRLAVAADFLSEHFFEVKRRAELLALEIHNEGSLRSSKSWDHFLVVLRGGQSLWHEYREMLRVQGVSSAEGGLWSTSESSYASLVEALVLARQINDDVLLTSLLKYDLPEILGEWRELVIEGKRGLLSNHESAREV
jgi:hypothetical protein